METIRESFFGGHRRPKLTSFHHAIAPCVACHLWTDVPIGGSLKAIRELEQKLGIELTDNKRLGQNKL